MTAQINRRYNFTTGMLLGLLGIPALVLSLPNIQRIQVEGREAALLDSPFEQQRAATNRQLKQAAKSSTVPLQMMRTASCTLVRLSKTGGDPRFLPNVKVFTSATNGQKVEAGTAVCNRQGQSGIVGVDGTIQSIAFTRVEDMPEYLDLYDKRIELQRLQPLTD